MEKVRLKRILKDMIPNYIIILGIGILKVIYKKEDINNTILGYIGLCIGLTLFVYLGTQIVYNFKKKRYKKESV